MATIVKLLIAAAIINATVRFGAAAWDYYQLKDEAQQIVVFGAGATPGQLRDQILKKARELQVPLAEEALEVRRDDVRTYATGSYRQPVEYFPGRTYPVELTFEVDAVAINATTARDVERGK